jgi:6-pyruvoyltetrahydropterin/6-carboxytetrahydropterin synthase
VYELRIISHLAAAHQLRDFHGECENLHGHNWKIEVFVTGREVGENGILMDFKEVKKATKNVVEELDHRFLNELEYFKNVNPSSENIARFIFDSLTQRLTDHRVTVSKVTAWESDSAGASYMGP